jgi:hypothetical protein
VDEHRRWHGTLHEHRFYNRQAATRRLGFPNGTEGTGGKLWQIGGTVCQPAKGLAIAAHWG